MREIKKVCVITIEVAEDIGFIARTDTLLNMVTFTEKTLGKLVTRLPENIFKSLEGTSKCLGDIIEDALNAD